MPYVVQPAAQHQRSPRIGHDLPHLFTALRIITVNPAMLAAWLLGFQRAFEPFGYCVFQKDCTFRAETAPSQISRQGGDGTYGSAMFPGAVNLDKLADQPDIFFLLSVAVVHGCDNSSNFTHQT